MPLQFLNIELVIDIMIALTGHRQISYETINLSFTLHNILFRKWIYLHSEKLNLIFNISPAIEIIIKGASKWNIWSVYFLL